MLKKTELSKYFGCDIVDNIGFLGTNCKGKADSITLRCGDEPEGCGSIFVVHDFGLMGVNDYKKILRGDEE